MQIANSFTINNKKYDSIGKLIINDEVYVVTQNGSDVVLLLATLSDNKYIYSIPQRNESDTLKYKGIMFASEIINEIKKDIESGYIPSKEELQKRIEKSSYILNNDVQLKNSLQNQSVEEFKASLKSLYEYFDEQVKKTPDLDFANYVSKNVNDKEYYFDTTNNDKMLVNRSDNSLTYELKDKENEARVAGESITSEEAYRNIEKEKEEITTTNIKDINLNDMSISNIDSSNIIGLGVVREAKKENTNVKGNIEEGIYMDQEGNVITTTEVKDNVVANQGGVVAAGTNEEVTENQIYSSEISNPLGIDENKVTLDEVEALLSRQEQLTVEQITYLEQLRVKKQNEYDNGAESGLTNSKQRKLISPWGGSESQTDNRAAYVNLIVLCLFVQVFMLLIIIGTIFFMK